MRTGATGLRAWVYQRISAIYLAVFFLYLIVHFLVDAPAGYDEWRAWMAQPVISIGAYLFFVSLMLHAWVGVRDVLIDYVHPATIRLTLLFFIGFGLIACAMWAIQVITLASTA